jgi:hypothetical protein
MTSDYPTPERSSFLEIKTHDKELEFDLMGKPPREEFVAQLREARAEWQKRFPKLPLSESV